jgi:hypothetical protein
LKKGAKSRSLVASLILAESFHKKLC